MPLSRQRYILATMYAEFFGLSKEPFSIAPDPRFLFMSEKHREALAHLLYGVGGGGGFVLLTGEIGAGKTTVCRAFLEQIPKHCDVAYIFNPKLSVTELLQSVCEEFHIALPERPAASRERGAGGPLTVKDHVDAINRFLLAAHAAGRSAVLIIDEAQSLAPDVLEQLRLLTNLETHERKLLQIILIGQPELRDMLASPGLEQLAQRVIARCHLSALTAGETVRYVQHRLAVAGGNGGGATVPFEPEAMSRLFQLTGGVPRRINLLAGRAMLGAYAHGHSQVDKRTVEQAAREVFDVRRGGGARAAARAAGADMRPRSSSASGGGGSSSRPAPFSASRPMTLATVQRRRWAWGALAAAGLLLVGLGAGAWMGRSSNPPTSSAASAALAASQAGASASTATPGAAAASLAAAGARPPSAAASGTAAAGALGAVGAAGAVPSAAVAGSGLAAGAGRAAGAASASAGERFDDPSMLLAAAWPDEASAWRTLAMAWRAPLGEGEACGRAAAAAGLACYRTRGGLAAVRQIDRPGLVLLRQRDEPAVAALLVALDDRGATLQTQSRHWRLSLAGLASVWRGEYATLWRPPPGWRELQASLAASAAASAPALPSTTRSWMQERLAEAGLTDTTKPLRERLWAYQVAQGLPPDGRPGPMTMMQLARNRGASEPVLLASALGPTTTTATPSTTPAVVTGANNAITSLSAAASTTATNPTSIGATIPATNPATNRATNTATHAATAPPSATATVPSPPTNPTQGR